MSRYSSFLNGSDPTAFLSAITNARGAVFLPTVNQGVHIDRHCSHPINYTTLSFGRYRVCEQKRPSYPLFSVGIGSFTFLARTRPSAINTYRLACPTPDSRHNLSSVFNYLWGQSDFHPGLNSTLTTTSNTESHHPVSWSGDWAQPDPGCSNDHHTRYRRGKRTIGA